MRAKGLCAKHYNAKAKAEGRIKPQAWNDRRRDAYHRRRARKAAATTGEPVILADIAARDGYRCFCGERVDMALAWPDPRSKSLDHIVPLSEGGAHDPSNVRLAHLRCNTVRGNRGGDEQLLLVG